MKTTEPQRPNSLETSSVLLCQKQSNPPPVPPETATPCVKQTHHKLPSPTVNYLERQPLLSHCVFPPLYRMIAQVCTNCGVNMGDYFC
ncbi:hypothetical protein I3842_Q044400 [Carya illinoinensis]|uniref:Uncharacterized protein n=1 Tax=Carya illinoinensis TaxID=32201 RepID=A0A922A2J6_CARIL|nr:hypothetical protein I3842_Q044400 [Carya illinoinensis]